MNNWIDDSVVLDFDIPEDIKPVLNECERLNRLENAGYFNWADALSNFCKEAYVQGHMTRNQWEQIDRRYIYGSF